MRRQIWEETLWVARLDSTALGEEEDSRTEDPVPEQVGKLIPRPTIPHTIYNHLSYMYLPVGVTQ